MWPAPVRSRLTFGPSLLMGSDLSFTLRTQTVTCLSGIVIYLLTNDDVTCYLSETHWVEKVCCRSEEMAAAPGRVLLWRQTVSTVSDRERQTDRWKNCPTPDCRTLVCLTPVVWLPSKHLWGQRSRYLLGEGASSLAVVFISNSRPLTDIKTPSELDQVTNILDRLVAPSYLDGHLRPRPLHLYLWKQLFGLLIISQETMVTTQRNRQMVAIKGHEVKIL